MFTLFYFENKFFTKFNLNTKFVGHQIFYKNKTEKKKKIICFLPGSRNVEIRKNLLKMIPIIKKSLKSFDDHKFSFNF